MKQATSAWGAIKVFEALKVRNKALIHQPSGSTAEDPHCQVEAQETWKKALQRSRASLKRATLWTLDFGL
jgi:predicted metal-binding protein